MKQKQYFKKRYFDKAVQFCLHTFCLCAGLLLFSGLPSVTAHAADCQGVTVYSSNNSLGAVSCSLNGASFSHYTYAQSTDYVTVGAVPVNKNYNFINWTDNGIVVSTSSSYSFSVGSRNHVLVAHFDSKPEFKHKRYDSDKDITSITRNTNACEFASGYKIDGLTVNSSLVPLDDETQAALTQLTGGNFAAAFQINLTFGYAGTPKQTLDHKTRLVAKLPTPVQGTCRIVSLSDAAPVVSEDLDSTADTVTFETNSSGLYAITCIPAGTAVPPIAVSQPVSQPVTLPALNPAPVQITLPEATASDAQTQPAAADVQPAAPSTAITQPVIPTAPAAPVTQQQYQESVINILRYQLQQAGLTPAA